MTLQATFVHVNLAAEDWRRLSAFYERVFGCLPVPPERHYRGEALERLTGVPTVKLRGVHLRLPGAGPDGPTLEIFEYDPLVERMPTTVNRPGYRHLAFAVSDVQRAREEVLDHGGRSLGGVETFTIDTGDQVTTAYVTDPEGNIIELQSWQPAGDTP